MEGSSWLLPEKGCARLRNHPHDFGKGWTRLALSALVQPCKKNKDICISFFHFFWYLPLHGTFEMGLSLTGHFFHSVTWFPSFRMVRCTPGSGRWDHLGSGGESV